MKHSYRVKKGDEGGFAWIDGKRRAVGETVKLTQEEAKYLLLAGIIGHHPLDRDRDGLLGGHPRPDADVVVPVPEVEFQPAVPDGFMADAGKKGRRR